MPQIMYPPSESGIRCRTCDMRADNFLPIITNEIGQDECWSCAVRRGYRICATCGHAFRAESFGVARSYCGSCIRARATEAPPLTVSPWAVSWDDDDASDDDDDSDDYSDDDSDDDDSDDDDPPLYDPDVCRCSSCMPGRGDILSYSYKPRPQFHGTGPVYLGAEIEVEVSEYKDRTDAAAIAAQHLGTLGYLKEDSSINYGFEIVTHPMAHKWAAEHFPWEMLTELRQYGCKTTNRVGLHVHVSRTGFSDPVHAYRWLKMLYRNSPGVSHIARRTSHEWAPWNDSDRRRAKDYAKGDHGYAPRYAAVNVTNSETFEVRVFRSTLNPVKLRAALDLVDGSVEYTRALTVADIAQRDGWTWPAFREWVSDRSEYSALLSQMGI